MISRKKDMHSKDFYYFFLCLLILLFVYIFLQVVHVSSTMHRTFTKEHWHKLHTLLTNWKSNLHTIREQVGHLAKAQIDLMHQPA